MRSRPLDEPAETQSMSAMTDVVFLLLIFFIVTMSGYMEMTLLETSLPTSGGAAASVELAKSLRIEIGASGKYSVNGVQQDRQSLNKLLRRYARLSPDVELLIQCEPDSKHHLLVTLLGDLANHKLKNVKMLK